MGSEIDGFDDIEGQLYDDTLDALERRRGLEQAGRRCAEVIVDLQDRGPLFQFARDRRERAMAALLALATVDPKETTEIVRHQAQISEYLDTCQWILGRIEEGEEAERQINEEFREGTNGEETHHQRRSRRSR